MTEFSKNELLRLVDKIPETDPTTTAYHVLMQSIECYNALALTVDEIIALRDAQVYEDLMEKRGLVKQQAEKIKEIAQDNVVPFNATDFPADTKDEVPEGCLHVVVPRTDEPAPPSLSASDVRKLLVEARGRGVNVKEVLKGFGADSFQALPADKYDALAEALRAV